MIDINISVILHNEMLPVNITEFNMLCVVVLSSKIISLAEGKTTNLLAIIAIFCIKCFECSEIVHSFAIKETK